VADVACFADHVSKLEIDTEDVAAVTYREMARAGHTAASVARPW